MISKTDLKMIWAKGIFNFRRLRLKAQFRRHMGYWGDFDNPQTYEEKKQFRKIYGNFPFYARVADKFRVRKYVCEKRCEKYLVPLLGVHEKLEPGVFRDLPASFVVEPSHGSDWKKIVYDKGRSNERESINYII